MATVEERLAFVEGRVQEHSQMFAGLRETIGSLEQRMDRRFDHVDARFTVVEERLGGIDRRIHGLEEKLDHRIHALEEKLDQRMQELEGKLNQRIDSGGQRIGALSAQVDRQLDALRQEMSSNQRWLVGLQVTTLLVVLGAVIAR